MHHQVKLFGIGKEAIPPTQEVGRAYATVGLCGKVVKTSLRKQSPLPPRRTQKRASQALVVCDNSIRRHSPAMPVTLRHQLPNNLLPPGSEGVSLAL